MVGLITYGTNVQVHEIAYSECPKAYVFRGSKDYSTTKIIQEMLGLGSVGVRPNAPAQPGRPAPPSGAASRFLLPVDQGPKHHCMHVELG